MARNLELEEFRKQHLLCPRGTYDLKLNHETIKTAQWVKSLAASPDNLTSIASIHMVEGKN